MAGYYCNSFDEGIIRYLTVGVLVQGVGRVEGCCSVVIACVVPFVTKGWLCCSLIVSI